MISCTDNIFNCISSMKEKGEEDHSPQFKKSMKKGNFEGTCLTIKMGRGGSIICLKDANAWTNGIAIIYGSVITPMF